VTATSRNSGDADATNGGVANSGIVNGDIRPEFHEHHHHVPAVRTLQSLLRSALTAEGRPPRVRDIDPHRVGATPTRYSQARTAPYIRRDADGELQSALTKAPCLLVIGETKAGKTRSAHECVRAVSPDAGFVHPVVEQGSVRRLLELDHENPISDGELVIWLDDLHNYLDAGAVDVADLDFAEQRTPRAVIVATLPLDRYHDDTPSRLFLHRAGTTCVQLAHRPSTGELGRARLSYPDEDFGDPTVGVAARLAATSSLAARPGPEDGTDPWAEYRLRLVREYRRLDLDALTPPERDEHLQIALRDVFIEPDVKADLPPAELPKALLRRLHQDGEFDHSDLPPGLDRQFVQQARESSGKRAAVGAFAAFTAPLATRCVLLGDPGAGKSTLAKYLALTLAESRTDGAFAALAGWQPLLIELRDYALHCDQHETFLKYLDYQHGTDQLGMPQDFLTRYLQDGGQVLVIFDGLDEVLEPRLRQTVARRVAGFAARYPNARVIVTSRVIGYRARILEDAGFTHYTMQDLDEDKVDRFLRSWYRLALHDRPTVAEHRRRRLDRAIRESAPIRELAGNPLLLTILAIIGKHQELPRERWKVYEHAARVLVQHWDINKHLDDERISADTLREDDKFELLRRLAIRMQEGTLGYAGNSLPERTLLQDVESYLATRFQYPPAKAAEIATAIVDQLRERNFIFARYGSGIYGFIHRALLEFFAASDIVHRFEKSRILSEEDLAIRIFVLKSEDPSWTEILRLIAGMVDATVAGRLVNRLLDSPGTYRSSALDRRPLAMVSLAAQCIAEIRNVNVAAAAAERTIEHLIELISPPVRSFGNDNRQEHLKKTVLPAFNAVPAWPGRERFREWFDSAGRFAISGPAGHLGAQLLAALYPGDRAVKADLHKLVTSAIPYQREAALFALAAAWKDDPETIQIVRARFFDPERFVQRSALELLIEHWPSDEQTLARLRLATQFPDANLRRQAIDGLPRHAAAEPQVRDLVAVALRADGAAEVRSAAARVLASTWTDHPETLPLLLNACADPAWEVRRTAIQTAVSAFAGDSRVYAEVLAATHDGDEDVRETALELLAGRWTDNPAAIGAALLAMRDPHYKVRRAAVRMIAQRWPDDNEGAAALQLAKRDHHGDVRVTALIARTDAVASPDEFLEMLHAVVLTDPLPDARRAALDMIAAYGGESSGATFTAALSDPDSDVRCAALRGLNGAHPHLPGLRNVILRLCADNDETVRLEAIQAAATYWGNRTDVFAALLRASRTESWKLRRAALDSMASLRPDDELTLRALSQCSADRFGQVRYVALLYRSAALDIEYLKRARLDLGTIIRQDSACLLYELGASQIETPTGADRQAAAYIAMAQNVTTDSGFRGMLNDPVPSVRAVAYGAILGRSDADAEKAVMLEHASRDGDADNRFFGLAALLAAFPNLPATSAARRRGLLDSSSSVRFLALESLILHSPLASETHQAMLTALGDKEWAVRRWACDTLVRQKAGDPATAAILRGHLHHPESTVREAALTALRAGWADDEDTFDAVSERLSDPSRNVRTQALTILATGWRHDPRTTDLLAEARYSVNLDLAELAYVFIDRKGQADLKQPVPDWRSPDPVLRAAALDRLARESGSLEILSDACRIAIRDDHHEIRTLANEILSTVDENAIDEFLIDAERQADYRVRQFNLDQRHQRFPASPQTRQLAQAMLMDSHGSVRSSALKKLIELTPEYSEINGTVAACLRNPDWRVRYAAVNALGTYGPDGSDTRAKLLRAVGDYDTDIRNAAFDYLILRWPTSGETKKAIHYAESDFCSDLSVVASDIRNIHSPITESNPPPHAPGTDPLAWNTLNGIADRAADETTSFTTVEELTRHSLSHIRSKAMYVLARRWPQRREVIGILTRGTHDEVDRVRQTSIDEIGMRATTAPQVLGALHDMASKDQEQFIRIRALKIVGLWPSPHMRETVLRAARHGKDDERRTALEILVRTWPDDNTQEAVRAGVCASSYDTQQAALRWLADRSPVRDLPQLAEESSPAALMTAAHQWGSHPEAAELLRTRLADTDDAVRVVAAHGLTLWKSWEALVDDLADVVSDPCPAVRQLAFEALYGPHIADLDVAWASDPDAGVRNEGWLNGTLADDSARHAEELVATIADLGPDASYGLLQRLCVWAGTGQIAPAWLLASNAAGRLTSGDLSWLTWLSWTHDLDDSAPAI
jgi:hypothetical protein